MLVDSVTRGYSDHSPLTRPKEEVTHDGRCHGYNILFIGSLKTWFVTERSVASSCRAFIGIVVMIGHRLRIYIVYWNSYAV